MGVVLPRTMRLTIYEKPAQSRRDCAYSPRLARQRLHWVWSEEGTNATGVVAKIMRANIERLAATALRLRMHAGQCPR